MNYTASIITVSDKGSRGERIDTAGPALAKILAESGYEILYSAMVPDEFDKIQGEILKCSDDLQTNLILTTGGTGFSPRDITPEATKAVLEREAPGLAELMRAESMKITPNGSLSRSVCGIRKRSLIVNLPGSEKGAKENLQAILKPLAHGIKMLLSEGSAECAAQVKENFSNEAPSMDAWLLEAKSDAKASQCGMYLFHTGVVRKTAMAQAREGHNLSPVLGMEFSYEEVKLKEAILKAQALPGIFYVRVWLAQGTLNVGDVLMRVLVGGDIRPNVLKALESLVSDLKNNCVSEKEIF